RPAARPAPTGPVRPRRKDIARSTRHQSTTLNPGTTTASQRHHTHHSWHSFQRSHPGRRPAGIRTGSQKGDTMTETVSGAATRKGRTAQAPSGGPARTAAAKAGPARTGGLKVNRIHTTPGVHPYDQVTWERRDVVMTNWRDGSINFEQHGVEFPDFWSVNAANIVTTKYFRGAVGSPQREWSLKQLVDRVVGTYTRSGREHGYFASDEDAEIFDHELKYALVHQIFSFNSPVWFNVGTSSPQQVSACFILSVDDTMDAIL